MNIHFSINIVTTIIKLLGIIPLALLVDGIFRKLLARMQNKVGPPIIQPFYDIVKLFGKKRSDSKGYKNILFRIIPFLYFLSTYSLFLFLLGIVKFQFDFILFIYIIILSSAMYILLGLVSNSPFGAFGSMRDMLLMICYEIALTVSLFSFIVYSDVLSLSQLNESWLILKLPLASLCLVVVALVETRITPFDTAEAETEIMGSVETEYSGKGLGFIELSRQLRLLFFVIMLTKFLFNPVGILYFILFSVLMFFILLFSQATTARYRMDQTFNVLIIVLIVSVIEFIRIHFWIF